MTRRSSYNSERAAKTAGSAAIQGKEGKLAAWRANHADLDSSFLLASMSVRPCTPGSILPSINTCRHNRMTHGTFRLERTGLQRATERAAHQRGAATGADVRDLLGHGLCNAREEATHHRRKARHSSWRSTLKQKPVRTGLVVEDAAGRAGVAAANHHSRCKRTTPRRAQGGRRSEQKTSGSSSGLWQTSALGGGHAVAHHGQGARSEGALLEHTLHARTQAKATSVSTRTGRQSSKECDSPWGRSRGWSWRGCRPAPQQQQPHAPFSIAVNHVRSDRCDRQHRENEAQTSEKFARVLGPMSSASQPARARTHHTQR